MKKTLFAILAMATCVVANAQVTLYDNGPIVTHAGQGAGGLDVSMSSLLQNTAGSNRKFFGPDANYYTVADDFKLNQNATLTSIILNGYETGANTPTWTSITVNLWSGKPGSGGAIIATATSTSVAQISVYRTFNGDLVGTTRKVNAITANFANIALTAGTEYWVSSQITAGGATGWANFVMDKDPNAPNNPITRKGNGLQFRDEPPASATNYGFWPAIVGTAPDDVTVEFPFVVKGNPAASTETLAPTAEQIVFGTTNSGGNLASWAADDNNGRKVCRFFIPNAQVMTRMRLTYTTTKLAPTAISFNVKISAHTPVVQLVTLRVENKVTNLFVDTNVVLANIVDGTTYNGVPPGTLANYVGGGGAMRGEIEIKQTGVSALSFPCTTFEFAQMAVTG